MWGQTTPDYSGTYFIASRDYDPNNTTANFYLCPTEPDETWPWYYTSTSPYYTNEANGQPFMTTFQCRSNAYHSGDASNAVWIVEKKSNTNYYYIKHASDGKYLTYNVALGNSSNAGRMRLHLEELSTIEDEDYALFEFVYVSSKGTYDIVSKYADDNNTYQYQIFMLYT